MMSLKSAIAVLAALAVVAGTALMPTDASAQRGRGFVGHPGVGRPGLGGYGGWRGRGGWGGWGGWVGVTPWWGYGLYASPYSYGPSCGYSHVAYYRHHRAYWHWVYVCQ